MAKSVLPLPAPPQTSVGRPRGTPPNVISSRPVMPVGAFDSDCARAGLRKSGEGALFKVGHYAH